MLVECLINRKCLKHFFFTILFSFHRTPKETSKFSLSTSVFRPQLGDCSSNATDTSWPVEQNAFPVVLFLCSPLLNCEEQRCPVSLAHPRFVRCEDVFDPLVVVGLLLEIVRNPGLYD
ncbi:hypothetical protein TRVL_03689 [Trypanosoma vivax]|nr:hypothetical protein TRVL_03689 [Trypanosoma vivax]